VRSIDSPPFTGTDLVLDTVADPLIDGRNEPRVDPYSAAAARACAHDTRVTGLFRNATSITSPRVS